MAEIQNPEQKSDEWLIKRLGKFCGSKVGELMAGERGKDKLTTFSQTGMAYIYQVAGERDLLDCYKRTGDEFTLFREATEISSKSLSFGNDYEPMARERYEKKTKRHMSEVSSCVCKVLPCLAASPDGFYCDDNGNAGVLEIKSQSLSVYYKYRNEVHDNETLKKMKPEYYWQCIAEMICTNAAWCDFTVFNPFVKHYLHITRIYPIEEDVSFLLAKVKLADEMVTDILNKE